jgi:hypothetical protein
MSETGQGGSDFTRAMIAESVAEIHDKGGACILCGAATRSGGVFFPTESFAARLKRADEPVAPAALVYALCNPCTGKKGYLDRVEAELLKDAIDRAGGNKNGGDIR